MQIVKRRAALRFYAKRLELFRTCAVAAALALSVLVPLANLPESALQALAGNPVFGGFLTSAEAGRAIWLNASIFQLPLPAVSEFQQLWHSSPTFTVSPRLRCNTALLERKAEKI
jgi:hypothetical protein